MKIYIGFFLWSGVLPALVTCVSCPRGGLECLVQEDYAFRVGAPLLDVNLTELCSIPASESPRPASGEGIPIECHCPRTGFVKEGGKCKDIDECGRGLHTCHGASVCQNTYGSYDCLCHDRSMGDGRKACRIEYCPSGWLFSERDRKCYRFTNNPKTYRDANATCWSYGGRLMHIRSFAHLYNMARYRQNSHYFWLHPNTLTDYDRVLHYNDNGLATTELPKAFVRLAGGGNHYGRVEVFHNGQWGSVCGQDWDLMDAMVVCSQLGFPRVKGAYTGDRYGTGQGPLWLSNVKCVGNERNLLSCNSSRWQDAVCSDSSSVASVACLPDLRIIAGGSYFGRVEMYVNGFWGTVCSDGWDNEDATVVCRHIGFDYGIAYGGGYYGQGTGPILLANVSCYGTEKSMMECSRHQGWGNVTGCTHAQDASVACYVHAPTNLRLVDGGTNFGRVELLHNGQWGSICDVGFDDVDAGVLCRQFGYASGKSMSAAFYGSSKGRIWLDRLACTGRENDILKCRHGQLGRPSRSCTHWEDVGVVCDQEMQQLPIRLANGSSHFGRVEVYYRNEWGTICSSGWDDVNAAVVCRQLGYGTGKAFLNNAYGSGSGRVWLSGVRCKGNEDSLGQCRHQTWGRNLCQRRQDAGVYCSRTEKEACMHTLYDMATDHLTISPDTDCDSRFSFWCEKELNLCADSNGGCSHTCHYDGKRGSWCTCPEYMDGLDTNNKSCKSTKLLVDCSDSEMDIILGRDLVPNFSQYNLRLNQQEHCRPRYNGSHYIFQAAFGHCGGKRDVEADGELIIYTNEINEKPSYRTHPQGLEATRLPSIQLEFLCVFNSRGIASAVFDPRGSIQMKQQRSGRMKFSLEITNNATRSRSRNTFTPIVVDLGGTLYIEGRIHSSDRLDILMDKCWASPSDNPVGVSRYKIIENGCAVDSTVQFLSWGDGTQRFSVQAFEFMTEHPLVYIHCQILSCAHNDSSSRCATKCNDPPRVTRRKRSIGGVVETQMLSATRPVFAKKHPVYLTVHDPVQTVLAIVGGICGLIGVVGGVAAWVKLKLVKTQVAPI